MHPKHMFDREKNDNTHFWGLYICNVYLSVIRIFDTLNKKMCKVYTDVGGIK